jgi:hypothetical protein
MRIPTVMIEPTGDGDVPDLEILTPVSGGIGNDVGDHHQ